MIEKTKKLIERIGNGIGNLKDIGKLKEEDILLMKSIFEVARRNSLQE
jgi:hypothetical protein